MHKYKVIEYNILISVTIDIAVINYHLIKHHNNVLKDIASALFLV